MEKKTEAILRGILIFIGVLFFVFAFYFTYVQVSEILDMIVNSSNPIEVLFSSFETFSIFLPALFLFSGLVIYKVGRHWDNFFKYLANSFISLGLFFLFMCFMIFPMNNSASEIADSLQPTIDSVIVTVVDDLIESQLGGEPYNGNIDLTYGESDEVREFFVKDLSVSDAEYLAGVFSVDFQGEEALTFSKIMISLIYEEMLKTDSRALDIPLPVSEFESMLESQMIGSDLGLLDVSLLGEIYPINDEAYLKLLISTNVVSKRVNPSSLSESDVNLIWNKLRLGEDISKETKKNIVVGFLSMVSSEMSNQPYVQGISLPLASISSLLPIELRNMVQNGIFSENMSKRVEALGVVRRDCKDESILRGPISVQMCEGIVITEYDTFMAFAISSNASEDMNMSMSPALLDFFDKISTTEKIEKEVYDMTSGWEKFFYIYLIFMIVALVSYYLHFKLFDREVVLLHIPYYVAKKNLFLYLPTFVLALGIYFVLASGILVSFVIDLFGLGDGYFNSEFFMNLAIYKVIMDINWQFLVLAIVYLVLSIGVYALFYFLLSRKLKNYG